MSFLTTDEALSLVGQGLASDVVNSQRQKGLRDTGASADSLRIEVSGSGKRKRLQLFGLSRWRFQQNGRGPNKSRKPSRKMVEDITQWGLRHGKPESAGYPMALKIAREGIRVPNDFNPGGVLSDPLNSKRVTGLLKTKLRPQYIQAARSLLFS